QNIRIDTRWATASADAVRKNAAELVALAPDVIFAPGASTVGPLLQVTHTLPIVFAVVADPVGAGFVDTLARPGHNATGFTNLEYGMGGKWLELLKEIAPSVTRVATCRGVLGSPKRSSRTSCVSRWRGKIMSTMPFGWRTAGKHAARQAFSIFN